MITDQIITCTQQSDFSRNIGLESDTENVISSYTSYNMAQQYQIDDDPSQYCQSTLKSLSVGQQQICLLHADHMPIITQGKSIE